MKVATQTIHFIYSTKVVTLIICLYVPLMSVTSTVYYCLLTKVYNLLLVVIY